MKNRKLTPEELEQFGKEMDALRDSIVKDLGQKDVDHIRNTIRFVRYTDAIGRILLHFGIDPVTFALGTIILGISKSFENMEIGHNVMHGQYDWSCDFELSSNVYDWDHPCSAKDWKEYHNYEHHTYTNILGKDKDIGYKKFRITKEQEYKLVYLLQPFYFTLLIPFFAFSMANHNNKNNIFFIKKIIKQISKDYIFFPLISFTNAPRVFLGNLLANRIRSFWLFSVIWCGHFPDGVTYYTQEECENESRGAWYLRQARGSANIEGGKLFYVATGHLSHQIEHHLFPDVPAARYPEMAPRVKEILEKYDQEYNTGTFFHQFSSVVKNVIKCSLP